MTLNIESVQQREDPAFVFDLPCLTYDRASRDVLHRALHDTLFFSEFSLHAHNFTRIPFADRFEQLPVSISSSNFLCHVPII